jgi:SAM-dependent methyltransferase
MADYRGSPGEIYERTMVPGIFLPWAHDLVARAAIKTGERVLDVGCGTGVVTRLAAQHVSEAGRIVGLDLNHVMLAAARAIPTGTAIEWREASATAMPFAAGEFDVVLSQQALQFIPDKLGALQEMHRVLAPRGRALISVWRSTRDNPGYRAVEEALGRHVSVEAAALPPFAYGNSRELRRVLTDAGFKRVRILSDAKMARFPSAEAFVRSIAAGAPSMLGALGEQMEVVLARIVADVTEALADSLDDEGLAFPQASNIAVAHPS